MSSRMSIVTVMRASSGPGPASRVLDVLRPDAERDAPAGVVAQRRPRGEQLRRHAELVRAEAGDETAVSRGELRLDEVHRR